MKIQIAACLATGAALLLLGSCGYKNDPVPPQSVVPVAIDNLRYSINDEGAELTWSYPAKTIKGAPVETLSSFKLFRAGVAVADYCRTCPIPFDKGHGIPGGEVYDGTRLRQGSYQVKGLKSGYRYFFKIRSTDSWFAESPDSNVITFVYSMPPAAPVSLNAKSSDGEVQLSWSAVRMLEDGSALSTPVQYQVMRSSGADFAPVGPLQSGLSWKDTTVSNGVGYRYAVRAVLVVDGSQVPGEISPEARVQPQDTTPPAAPAGVQVVSMAKGVKVIWDPVEVADLAGYKVYRSSDGRTYHPVGEVKATVSIFNDSDADAEATWYYTVTAFDRNGNESRRSEAGRTRD